ncbi:MULTISPECIES: TetR/AcrR family transcriptional regulator [unclassified Novosphingobium]|jgi:AcrR family transcriptional regulator|uniref:TetR/AcrR family transcriptional regulator n=1 Tax=unclassified Novosphingobium TaxID=2644732 RepID=UPI000F7E26E4|nr:MULTISPECIES: TetR/AcrR family transcriptional regulator [unclassified Novosphingobium]
MAEDVLMRGRGRPRETEKDEAIRQATWALLARVGYDGLTFEAVAEAAGISRTTLYRRFSAKSELVANALYETSRKMEREMVFSDDPATELLAHVRNAQAFMTGARGRAVVTITESASRTPELAHATEAAMAGDEQRLLGALSRLRPQASHDRLQLAFSVIVGALMFHQAMRDEEMPANGAQALVAAATAVLDAPA